MEKQVVRIERNLDMVNALNLKRTLNDALEKGIKHIELDFTETESVDSSGLGKLLLFNEKFIEAGGEFRLVNVRHPEVVELFRLINLGGLMTVDYSN